MQNGLVFFGFDGQTVDRGVNDLFFFALGKFVFHGGALLNCGTQEQAEP